MVKHIILWKLKEINIKEERDRVISDIKTGLEGLKGQIEGLIDIKVNVSGLSSSNMDIMLDCTLKDEEALKRYANHEKHLYVANTFVRPYTEIRSCFDYEI